MLLQANSGGGKSYAVRRLCEITHGKVQQIILDPEGEFATLREKYDYILVGGDGDIPINVRSSELLARRILELGTSAIIDLYELKHNERKQFVKQFLDSLIEAPKSLWHPCIIIVDEAHKFAPEKGHGESIASEAIINLATTGRKRGFALICATQRLSKLSKDVVAELNTKLIGRSSLDVDMKRAGFELGFTSKDDLFSLRNLDKGEFYAFGSALTNKVTKIKIDKCVTTHPEAGQIQKAVKIASSKKIQSVLSKLVDLPQEAESEIKTKEDMTSKIFELKRELLTLKRNVKPVIDNKQQNKLLKMIDDYQNKILKYQVKITELENQAVEDQDYHRKLYELVNKKKSNIKTITHSIFEPVETMKHTVSKISIPITDTVTPDDIFDNYRKIGNNSALRVGAMKMLKVAAQFYPGTVTKQQMGTIAVFTIKGGTFKTYLSELQRTGWIEVSGNDITITESGLENVGNIEPLSTDPSVLLEMWASKFRVGAGNLLKVIAQEYPNHITKEMLGEKANMIIEGGTFKTYLSELRRNGLITISGDNIKASKELFP